MAVHYVASLGCLKMSALLIIPACASFMVYYIQRSRFLKGQDG